MTRNPWSHARILIYRKWAIHNVDRFHSRGQHLCIMALEQRKKSSTPTGICLQHQHGSRLLVLEHQYISRDVMLKYSISAT